MANSSNLYRGHTIEKVGHGKRTVFQTIINDKPCSALTLPLVKASIDTWIDEGVEPSEAS
jgi:ribosomal protein S16